IGNGHRHAHLSRDRGNEREGDTEAKVAHGTLRGAEVTGGETFRAVLEPPSREVAGAGQAGPEGTSSMRVSSARNRRARSARARSSGLPGQQYLARRQDRR